MPDMVRACRTRMLLTVSGLQQCGALAAVVTLIHVHMFAVPVMPADSRATQVWWHPGWAAGHRRTGPCRRMASLTDASPSGQESTWCNEGRTGLHQTMSTGMGSHGGMDSYNSGSWLSHMHSWMQSWWCVTSMAAGWPGCRHWLHSGYAYRVSQLEIDRPLSALLDVCALFLQSNMAAYDSRQHELGATLVAQHFDWPVLLHDGCSAHSATM